MHFSAFGLLAGRRHQLDAVVLMRGESFMETVEPGRDGGRRDRPGDRDDLAAALGRAGRPFPARRGVVSLRG